MTLESTIHKRPAGRQGKEYWQRERELCATMLRRDSDGCAALTLDSVHACSSGKSFDYRVRNARGLAVMRALKGCITGLLVPTEDEQAGTRLCQGYAMQHTSLTAQ